MPALDFETPPLLTIDAVKPSQDRSVPSGTAIRLGGQWTALSLALDQRRGGIAAKLRTMHDAAARADTLWDLSPIQRLDHVGAQALWQIWGRRLPPGISLTSTQREIFNRITLLEATREPAEPAAAIDPITRLGLAMFDFAGHLRDGITLLGGLVMDGGRLLRDPRRIPWREISANVYAAGAQALPITALVAFLIGIVLSYLSAQQLRLFGANAYIVNILGLSIIRELGPVLAAILVAGRSGSAITAQLGVMRVTEELDAMRVMGISHGLRLIFPRVIALGVAMPLLVMWTDAIALTGGMLAAQLVLNIDMSFFIRSLPNVVPVANLYIGLGKGVAFGMLIALVGCHFGLRIKPNSQSLGEGTTTSVVSSITVVILADAVFAIMFQRIGLS
ncbi:phospholipid/cholesterol/gamma-HCH transport system permease protein [Burkholderia sp. b13]|nr:phospholipid/cholesterol/gamma-HCH transport system permease protein [Burkholderia sp. b13]